MFILTFQNHTNRPLTDFGGKTSIFSHPVYLFLREFSLQDFRGGSVFLRNAEGSRVCSLYDEMALSRIINDGMHHPLSREPITLSMLVAREQCEFDCSIGHFTVRSDCYSV
ncbi:T3SS effector NleG family protein [Escherichia coli]|uniref:T3SS effector NleG family protein n=1 Tax=Escherichia coli TaxID=562 RepID=UPI003D6A39EC